MRGNKHLASCPESFRASLPIRGDGHRFKRFEKQLWTVARGNPPAGESLFRQQERRCAAPPARRSAPGIRTGRAAVPRKQPCSSCPDAGAGHPWPALPRFPGRRLPAGRARLRECQKQSRGRPESREAPCNPLLRSGRGRREAPGEGPAFRRATHPSFNPKPINPKPPKSREVQGLRKVRHGWRTALPRTRDGSRKGGAGPGPPGGPSEATALASRLSKPPTRSAPPPPKGSSRYLVSCRTSPASCRCRDARRCLSR
jgi:hypothetical protein